MRLQELIDQLDELQRDRLEAGANPNPEVYIAHCPNFGTNGAYHIRGLSDAAHRSEDADYHDQSLDDTRLFLVSSPHCDGLKPYAPAYVDANL